MLEDFSIDESQELEDEIIEIPKEVRKLRTQPYDKSVSDLMGMIERGDINLRPDFQRNVVWDNKKASLLIESIWLSIPIPQIFVSVEEDGTWNVIDGQQRLTSLKRYYENDFKLKGLEVLGELNGFSYDKLEDKPQRLLNGGNIRIVAIHEDSHPDIKFDVFMRINQGAVQLNPQELRNCLYRGELNDKLHALAENPQLLEILKLTEPHNRFKDVEMILRYLALSDSHEKGFSNYPSIIKKFLNDFMHNNRTIDNDKITQLQSKFDNNLKKVFSVFGANAFKKWDNKSSNYDTKINLSIMDCQMIALEAFDHSLIEEKKEQFRISFNEIFDEPDSSEFLDSITSGTSSKKKLEYRVNFIKNRFSDIAR